MACKGICKRHKAPTSTGGSKRRYFAGQKRCAICEIFIKWDGLWCPCCGCRLRSKPKNTVDRKRAMKDLLNPSSNRLQLLLLYH